MIYYLAIPGWKHSGGSNEDAGLFTTLEAAEKYAALWEGAYGYEYVDIIHITPDNTSVQKLVNTIWFDA